MKLGMLEAARFGLQREQAGYPMIRTYIQAAMDKAHYELIDQPGQSYYGEVPGLPGLMATGATLEECRQNLEDALDAWLVLGLQLGHTIPEIGGVALDRLRAAG